MPAILEFYNIEPGRLTSCETLGSWEAVDAVTEAAEHIAVVEDVRRVGLDDGDGDGRDDLRGRRRDTAAQRVDLSDARVRLWLELLERLGIPTAAEKPTRQKCDAETFARVTGWEGRTNEHARDAGRLVFGRSAGEVRLRQRLSAGDLRSGRSSDGLSGIGEPWA